MAGTLFVSSSRRIRRRFLRRPAASLIELLVVLFIIGIMLSLLLPALSGARSKANQVVCENNLRQVSMALVREISVTKKFPPRNRWPVAILRWIEEVPLYDAMKNNVDPKAVFARPALLVCPFQEEFPSRLTSVGFCHFVLVVDRPRNPRQDRRLAKDVHWDIMDRKLLADDPEQPEQPWYIGPEMTFMAQAWMLANEPGPHPDGKYMTDRGILVP